MHNMLENDYTPKTTIPLCYFSVSNASFLPLFHSPVNQAANAQSTRFLTKRKIQKSNF